MTKLKEGETVEMAGLQFSDISSEKYREYTFPSDGYTYVVRIDKPMLLNVRWKTVTSDGREYHTADVYIYNNFVQCYDCHNQEVTCYMPASVEMVDDVPLPAEEE